MPIARGQSSHSHMFQIIKLFTGVKNSLDTRFYKNLQSIDLNDLSPIKVTPQRVQPPYGSAHTTGMVTLTDDPYAHCTPLTYRKTH